MPTYRYKCTNKDCDYLFEVFQKITDDPISHCPNCAQSTVSKVPVNGSFSLKGSGWYRDGYGKNVLGNDPSS